MTGSEAPLELGEVLYIQTAEGVSLPFEVVGILDDDEETYAVLLHRPADGGEELFIVTDLAGNLLESDEAAQEILEDFLAYAQDEESDAPEEEEP